MDEWRCEHGGRDEAVRYIWAGPKPKIEYLVSGRRKQEFCKVHETERDARRDLERIVAQTTLASTSRKIRTLRAA